MVFNLFDMIFLIVVKLTDEQHHRLTRTIADSQYLLIIGVKFEDEKSSADLKIVMHGPKGYLSAHEYPLLNFYMV